MSTPEDEYSRTVELQVDGSFETLGDQGPRTVTEAEQRILMQQALKTRVTADVVALAHGTFKGQPASLVGLQFRFGYPPQSSNRLSSAVLNISFGPGNDGTGFPTVHRFAPVRISADSTTTPVERDTRHGVSVSIDASPVPVSVDFTADRGTKVAYVQDFGCDVDGHHWTSDDAESQGYEVDNAVTWYLNEHKLRKEGIPKELRTVVVVGRSQPAIRAEIKARVKTSWDLRLFGFPFPQARPLVISESVVFGHQPPTLEFEKLSDDGLAAFVGLLSPSSSMITSH